MRTTTRVLAALVLLAVAGCCAFGFAATFEPPFPLAWRAAYAVLGAISLAGAIGFARPRGKPRGDADGSQR